MVEALRLTLMTMPSPITSLGRSFHSYFPPGAPEAVHRVLLALILRNGLCHRALIAEDAEVIADLDSLVGSEIYVDRIGSCRIAVKSLFLPLPSLRACR